MKSPFVRTLLVALLPALVIAVLFRWFLGHRSDYLGHYAAGYGGSLAAMTLVLAALPVGRFPRLGVWTIAPGCLACIALGAVTEATVFRLAKFDEVDFCNQSLGAVLAGLAVLAIVGESKPRDIALWSSIAIGIGFLLAGFYFALG